MCFLLKWIKFSVKKKQKITKILEKLKKILEKLGKLQKVGTMLVHTQNQGEWCILRPGLE